MNFKRIFDEIEGFKADDIKNFLLNLHPIFWGVLMVINIGIPILTLFYYFWQFEFYHPIFWIFIPDSYSYAILFAIFIAVTLIGKKDVQILNLIAFIGLCKVFIGYIVLFTLRPPYFDIVSFLAHTFELIEGVLIIPFLKPNKSQILISGSILTLDWYFDFLNPFGLPTLALYPYHAEFNIYNVKPFIGVYFVIYSLIIFVFLAYFWKKHQKTISLS